MSNINIKKNILIYYNINDTGYNINYNVIKLYFIEM